VRGGLLPQGVYVVPAYAGVSLERIEDPPGPCVVPAYAGVSRWARVIPVSPVSWFPRMRG
jgi:hypothetical protein